jgi:hypothetical protein
MDSRIGGSSDRRTRVLCALLLVTFGLAVLEPLRMRAKGPSIYADDVVRIAQVRTMPLSQMVVRPFNEHLAPLFELETAAVWSLCGERLSHAPLAFTLASLLPFLFCEIALLTLLRRETASWTAALAGVAVFGVTWLPIETAWWYSASSFAWSLLGVLIAWTAMLRPGRRGLTIAILASLAAPAFSMIGILAGPIAVLRGAIGKPESASGSRFSPKTLLPLAGTAGFLLFAAIFGHRSALAGSVRRNVHLWEAIGPILRAPVTVLIPALAGVKDLDHAIPHLAASSICILLVVGLLGLVARRKLSAGLVLGGMGLIGFGYGLTYAARAGTDHLMHVQRYHLFPQAGLALIVGAVVATAARRADRRPVLGMSLAAFLALTLLATHRDELKGRARHLRFDGQGSTLAAMERLERFCESHSIDREHALASLDPIRKQWFDFDLNALTMLNVPNATAATPPEDVRAAVLSTLSPDEREALWGGMEVTTLAARPSSAAVEPCMVQGRLDHAYRISPPPSDLPEGLSFLEFRINLRKISGERPRTLRLDGLPTNGTVEVWWKGHEARWDEARSFRLEAVAIDRAEGQVSIPLHALPHWDESDVERLRIRFHGPGRLGMIAPRFYR